VPPPASGSASGNLGSLPGKRCRRFSLAGEKMWKVLSYGEAGGFSSGSKFSADFRSVPGREVEGWGGRSGLVKGVFLDVDLIVQFPPPAEKSGFAPQDFAITCMAKPLLKIKDRLQRRRGSPRGGCQAVRFARSTGGGAEMEADGHPQRFGSSKLCGIGERRGVWVALQLRVPAATWRIPLSSRYSPTQGLQGGSAS
jgi:hypothetical protein